MELIRCIIDVITDNNSTTYGTMHVYRIQSSGFIFGGLIFSGFIFSGLFFSSTYD